MDQICDVEAANITTEIITNINLHSFFFLKKAEQSGLADF